MIAGENVSLTTFLSAGEGGWGAVVKIPIFADFSFPKVLFYTFPSNFANFLCLRGLSEISSWHHLFCLPIFNLSMALISKPLVRFEWISPHCKAIMLLFSKIMRLSTFHVIVLLTSQFIIDPRKIWHVAIFNSIQPNLIFLVYLLVLNVLSVCRSLKKLKNEGSTMFNGSIVQKLEEKYFIVKIWIIIKKIWLRQRKMNGCDAITFWYFKITTQ